MIWSYLIGVAVFAASSPETRWLPRIAMALTWFLWLPIALVGIAVSLAILASAYQAVGSEHAEN